MDAVYINTRIGLEIRKHLYTYQCIHVQMYSCTGTLHAYMYLLCHMLIACLMKPSATKCWLHAALTFISHFTALPSATQTYSL